MCTKASLVYNIQNHKAWHEVNQVKDVKWNKKWKKIFQQSYTYFNLH